MARRRALVTAALALLAAGALAYALGWIGGPEPLTVAASAPRAGGGLTAFVIVSDKLASLANDVAAYEIRYGGAVIYPPGGVGGSFSVENGRGTLFVPYHQFVVGNGPYEVVVRYGSHEGSAQTSVVKWVDYVYLKPYDRGSSVWIDAQLSRSAGGSPSDRVTTDGELALDLVYRGVDGKAKKFLSRITTETEAHDSFTRLEVPRSKFSEGSGYYSVEATFHNAQARNNLNVGNDPLMAQRSPPANWIWIGPR